MKKCMAWGLAALALVLGGVGRASADGALSLYYVITDLGDGTNQFDFTLQLDNTDGSWQPGQGFGWVIWGDAQNTASPMADFQMLTGFPVGPWTDLGFSGGYHNGPNFAFVLDTWVPANVGDNLQWSGISAFLPDPSNPLLFSSIYTTGGAPIIEFQQAIDVTP